MHESLTLFSINTPKRFLNNNIMFSLRELRKEGSSNVCK